MYLEAKPPKLRGLVSSCLREPAVQRLDLLDLVEDYAAGLVDAEEPHDGRNDGEEAEEPPIVSGELENVIVLDAVGGVVAGLGVGLGAAPGRLRSGSARRRVLAEVGLFGGHDGS